MEQTGLTADCSINVDPFDRADCEEAKFPACANDTQTLLKNSKALFENVQAKYLDFPAVPSRSFTEDTKREQLCALTRAELRDHYLASTNYTESILKLQKRADNIKKCSKQIEEWLEDQPVQNDTLLDSIIREAQDDLGELAFHMNELSTLFTELKEAGPKMYNFIRVHSKFCPADSQSRKKS